MSLSRARIVKAAVPGPTATSLPVAAVGAPGRGPRAGRVPAEALAAREQAARIVAEAEATANALVADARARASSVAEAAAREAREAELGRLAAYDLALRAREEARAERELGRVVELAVALAERLVGEALRLDPSRLRALATEALREARGARRVRVAACPADVEPLRGILATLGEDVAELVPDPELGAGSLVVETELGHVDARLCPRLERLAAALREVLDAERPPEPGPGIRGERR